MKTVVGVLCSDLHLCHTAPSCREEEPSWYDVQRRVLQEVIDAANEHRCPLIIAGDIFDRWASPPELINFAIDMFRQVKTVVFAVPGQHDLPNHDYDQMHRSAYGSLVKAEVIHTLPAGTPTPYTVSGHKVLLFSFPWGETITPEEESSWLQLAVVHKYIWRKGSSYPGATEESNYTHLSKELMGYHAAVFGDNHKGFLARIPREETDTVVLKNGTMMRRKTDEVTYCPQYGLFMSDGTIETVLFNTKKDILVIPKKEDSVEVNSDQFHEYLNGLRGLEAGAIDYREQVLRVLSERRVKDEVRGFVLEALGS